MFLSEEILRRLIREEIETIVEEKGMWYYINKRKKQGKKPHPPGHPMYPDKKTWKKLTKEEFDLKAILSSFGINMPSGLSEDDENDEENE